VTFVIYVISGLFILLGISMVFAYLRIGHHGILLMGITYGGSAALALWLMHWWPLTAGFALVWAMRMLGLESGSGTRSGEEK
jgi:hypothetical protein